MQHQSSAPAYYDGPIALNIVSVLGGMAGKFARQKLRQVLENTEIEIMEKKVVTGAWSFSAVNPDYAPTDGHKIILLRTLNTHATAILACFAHAGLLDMDALFYGMSTGLYVVISDVNTMGYGRINLPKIATSFGSAASFQEMLKALIGAPDPSRSFPSLPEALKGNSKLPPGAARKHPLFVVGKDARTTSFAKDAQRYICVETKPAQLELLMDSVGKEEVTSSIVTLPYFCARNLVLATFAHCGHEMASAGREDEAAWTTGASVGDGLRAVRQSLERVREGASAARESLDSETETECEDEYIDDEGIDRGAGGGGETAARSAGIILERAYVPATTLKTGWRLEEGQAVFDPPPTLLRSTVYSEDAIGHSAVDRAYIERRPVRDIVANYIHGSDGAFDLPTFLADPRSYVDCVVYQIKSGRKIHVRAPTLLLPILRFRTGSHANSTDVGQLSKRAANALEVGPAWSSSKLPTFVQGGKKRIGRMPRSMDRGPMDPLTLAVILSVLQLEYKPDEKYGLAVLERKPNAKNHGLSNMVKYLRAAAATRLEIPQVQHVLLHRCVWRAIGTRCTESIPYVSAPVAVCR